MTDAAATIGVHRATPHAWVKLAVFRALMADLRRDALRSSADLIRSNLGKAARVLAPILDDPQAAARDKLTAAGIAYKVAGNALPGLEVPPESEPASLDVLAVVPWMTHGPRALHGPRPGWIEAHTSSCARLEMIWMGRRPTARSCWPSGEV